MDYRKSREGPRIVCVGSNLESEIAIKGLLDTGANIIGLVTIPPGKGPGISDYVDLHPLCREKGITVVDTLDVNSTDTLRKITALKPDYIFTLGWSQLFKDDILKIPTHYVVGSHPAPLPEGRGRAPVPWTILQGYTRSAVTLFRMDTGVDSGPVLHQEWFDVPKGIYALELYGLVARNFKEAYCKLYRDLMYDTVKEKPQDHSRATYRAKRTPADGHIDFNSPAAVIETLVRAVSKPYPGAYAYYKGKKVYIWKAALEDIPPYIGVIGQILTRENNKLLVQASDKPLWLSDFTDDHEAIPTEFFNTGSKFNYCINDELYKIRCELEALKSGGNNHEV